MLRLTELLRNASPVQAAVAGALLIIVGILVIIYPGLTAWLAGIGFVLAGIGVLVSAFLPGDRLSSS